MGVTEVHKTYDIRPFQDALLKTGRVIEMSSFASLMNIREPVREQSCYEFVELFFFVCLYSTERLKIPNMGPGARKQGREGGSKKTIKRKEKKKELYFIEPAVSINSTGECVCSYFKEFRYW